MGKFGSTIRKSHQMLVLSSALIVFCLSGVLSLPNSMVEDIKAKELMTNKVKRVSLPAENVEENENHFHDNPTAIKRGTGLKNLDDDPTSIDDWSSDTPNIDDFQSPLFNEENSEDWKNLKDYEKGFRYGMNKENMDEALENAVLKSELYGGGFSPLNQYRYLENERRKRRKRNLRDFNYLNQDGLGDLTPEETQALLNIYENEAEINNLEQDDDTWLEIPVRPRLRYSGNFNGNNKNPKYLDILSPHDLSNNNYNQQSKWTGDAPNHFMSKKKTDSAAPRGLLEQFWTNNPGPKYKRDYYTLSQLLSNQREPNVPVYHRYVL